MYLLGTILFENFDQTWLFPNFLLPGELNVKEYATRMLRLTPLENHLK